MSIVKEFKITMEVVDGYSSLGPKLRRMADLQKRFRDEEQWAKRHWEINERQIFQSRHKLEWYHDVRM